MRESFTSRSAILTRQNCPRKWWWEYGIPNETSSIPGIVPARLDMNLLTGSAYHVGMETLLSGGSTEEAVGRALEGDPRGWPGIWPLLKSKGVIIGDKEDAFYVAWEQASLVEALIRGYAIALLPPLLSRFEVVEIEADGEEFISIPDIPDFRVRFGYRADGLLLERESNDLYVLSYKTTKSWRKKKEDAGHRDMQGLSEVAAIEQRLERWHNRQGDEYYQSPAWFRTRLEAGYASSITGVKMEYALKGDRKEYPIGSGKYFFTNPLIRPWKRTETPDSPFAPKRRGKPSMSANLGSPYAISWNFKDEFGGSHTLGKGWRIVNIWEDMGVKNWIEYLAENNPTAIEDQFVTPIEFYRSAEDIERWKRKTVYAEERNYEARKTVLESTSFAEYAGLLDAHYDTHSDHCDYPVKCPYQEICYGPEAYLINPLSSMSYEPRTPNHKTELIQISPATPVKEK